VIEEKITLARTVSGICVVVVAGLILWISSSIVSHETRLSVLENNISHINGNIGEIKTMVQDLIREIKQRDRKLEMIK